jgi:hypothetical protein
VSVHLLQSRFLRGKSEKVKVYSLGRQSLRIPREQVVGGRKDLVSDGCSWQGGRF